MGMKKNTNAVVAEAVETPVTAVHPLLKSHTIVSKKDVDYNNLTAFEASSMAAVLVLAVLVGTIQAITIA